MGGVTAFVIGSVMLIDTDVSRLPRPVAADRAPHAISAAFLFVSCASRCARAGGRW